MSLESFFSGPFSTSQANVGAPLSNYPTVSTATSHHGQPTIRTFGPLSSGLLPVTENPASPTNAASTPSSLTISMGSNAPTQCPPSDDAAVIFENRRLACYDEFLIGWDPEDKEQLVIYVYRSNVTRGPNDWEIRVCTSYAGQTLDQAIESCQASYDSLFDLSQEIQGPIPEYVKAYIEHLTREGHVWPPTTTYVAPLPPIPTFNIPNNQQPSQFMLDWRDFWEHGGRLGVTILAPMTGGVALGSIGLFYYARRMGGMRAAWVDLERRGRELRHAVGRRLVPVPSRGNTQVPQAGFELDSLGPRTGSTTTAGV
ncbi:hypothetical protein QFC22_002108 [Naganishia vaughanmartiniae]|uniref:Uncharacterized protein n=1 Tax=Naganishia vaughanmartiniae TaxID=1424756 RepID=A0ACC2XC48_9TREE|nr:hypothetical protein QFC22_002108 [Naganishia vaughanmartiniae]